MANEPARFVLGIAYQAGPDPRIKRGMDGGRDMFSKAELERAAWSYMRSGCPQINAFHVDGTEDCAEPVESFIWRWPDWDVGDGIVVKDGDWCLGAILSPHMWDLHKQGKVNGLSPQGTARRRRVQKEGAVSLAKGSADEAAEDDDEFTELLDANVPTVALVGAAANGIPRFLISKQRGDAALLDPEYVRGLIAKSEPIEPQEAVTLSGSPAAIAALIHGAPVRKAEPDPAPGDEVEKAEASSLLREAVGKAVLACCEDLFPGYLSPVEEPMVVRAEHDDVLKSVCATVFPGHNVADIAGRLVPTAQRALVEKLGADCFAPGVHSAVAFHDAAPDLAGMPSALAALRAVCRLGPDRSVVRELASANLAGLRKSAGSVSDTRRALVLEAARAAAEFGSRISLGSAGNDGTTAKLAGLRHGLSLHEEIQKADASTAALNDRPDSDFAFIESGGTKDESGKTTPRSLRHFPIYDAAHVRNALSRAPQSPFGDKAMPKIRAAAKKFNIDVSKEIDMAVVTGETDDGIDGMDPTVVLAEPDEEQPGDPMEPGSPAWEAIDAATARKWTSILVRAKNALGVMADRELLEAATADPDDEQSAWDLQDAQCAIDYVIDTLAGFAVGEQAEADLGGEAMDAVGKALAGFDTAALDTIESLTLVRKAGRVLSSANEAAIREAVTSLQKVLASLPDAPKADEPAAMEKESAVTETEQPEAAPAPEAPVEKAKGDPQLVVYDQKGRLLGIVDPGDLTPVANGDGDADTGDSEPATDAPADADPAPPADSATATDAATLIPGTNTVASPPPAADDDEQVTKAVQAGITPLLTEALAPFAKQIAEQAERNQALADQLTEALALKDVVKSLQERVEHLAKMPDDRKPPLLNGATGKPGMAARDGSGLDPYADLEKAVAEASDPGQRRDAEQRLAYARVRDRFAR